MPAVPPTPVGASRREVFAYTHGRTGFEASVRVLLAMGAPMVVAVMLGRPDVGSLMSIGAFAAPNITPWTYRQRALRLPLLALAMGTWYTVGSFAVSLPYGAVLIVGLAAAAAVLVAGLVGEWAGQFATIVGVACILGSGLRPPGIGPLEGGAIVAAGGLWVAFVFLLGWRAHRWDQQATAVSATYEAVADYFAALGSPRNDAARIAARRALLTGWDAAGGRPVGASDRRRHAQFVALLALAQRLLDGAASLAFAGADPVPRDLPDALRAVAVAVDDQRMAGLLRVPVAPDGASPRLAMCYEYASHALETAAGNPPPTGLAVAPLRETLADRWHRMRPVRTVQILVATRIGVAVTLAGIVASLPNLTHGYWVAISTMIVMRSDPAATNVLAVQRTLGTVLGVAVGGVMLLVEPSLAFAALAMCVVGYFMPAAQKRSFLLGSALRTCYALLLIEAVDPGQFSVPVLGERVLDTLLGALIAVAATLLLWPTAATQRLPKAVATSLRTDASLLRAAAAGSVDQGRRDGLIIGLLNLRVLFDQAVGERRVRWPDTEKFWPVVVFTLRMGAPLRLTAGSGDREETAPLLPLAAYGQMSDALDDIAAAVEAGREPPPLPWQGMGPESQLQLAAEELHVAATAAAAPPRPGVS